MRQRDHALEVLEVSILAAHGLPTWANQTASGDTQRFARRLSNTRDEMLITGWMAKRRGRTA